MTEPLLFLVHRIPFPPNKGDKIRSHHLLRHLAQRYAVHLGTFADAAEDMAYVPELASFATSYHVEPLDPRAARLRSVTAFLTGEALTLPYYRSAALQQWVRRTVAEQGISKAVVFSGAMAQYVHGLDLHVVLDFVDVDSAKWSQYAKQRAWPSSFVYRREGQKLLSYERMAALESRACVFATRGEADLFGRHAADCGDRVHVIQNGVNSEFFAPDERRESPYGTQEAPIVFTGAMDYWPNVDAVVWFARSVLPGIRAVRPDARFHIVGMNPTPTVTALDALPGVSVRGRVDDIRPYVQHAAVVVAPLRVARGIQNKILEAMAMKRPVVASTAAGAGLSAVPGRDFETAGESCEFAQKVVALLGSDLGDAMGRQARRHVMAEYNWDRNLADYDVLLVAPSQAGAREAC